MCNAHHCILMMLELRNEAVDKNEAFGALITDLSNAYDYLWITYKIFSREKSGF